MKDDGYRPAVPGDNDRGYHHPVAIDKPLVRGSLDGGTAYPLAPATMPATHVVMPGKVAATVRPAPPANEIKGPAYTSGKPAGRRR